MHISSAIFCSSNYLSSSLLQLPTPQRFIAPFKNKHFHHIFTFGLSEFTTTFGSHRHGTLSLVRCTGNTIYLEFQSCLIYILFFCFNKIICTFVYL